MSNFNEKLKWLWVTFLGALRVENNIVAIICSYGFTPVETPANNFQLGCTTNNYRTNAKTKCKNKTLFDYFGAYEIADNQVVLAVFKVNLEYKDDDSSPHISKTEASFAEDTIYLRCPFSVRDLLSQPDYVAKAEEVYPRIMEELLKEKENERRKSKVKWTKEQIEEINKMIENDDIPFWIAWLS